MDFIKKYKSFFLTLLVVGFFFILSFPILFLISDSIEKDNAASKITAQENTNQSNTNYKSNVKDNSSNYNNSTRSSSNTYSSPYSSNNLSIGQTADFGGIEITLLNAYKYDEPKYYLAEGIRAYLVLEFQVSNNTAYDYSTSSININVLADEESTSYTSSDQTLYSSIGTLASETYGTGTVTYPISTSATQFEVTVSARYPNESRVTYSFTLKDDQYY